MFWITQYKIIFPNLKIHFGLCNLKMHGLHNLEYILDFVLHNLEEF